MTVNQFKKALEAKYPGHEFKVDSFEIKSEMIENKRVVPDYIADMVISTKGGKILNDGKLLEHFKAVASYSVDGEHHTCEGNYHETKDGAVDYVVESIGAFIKK